MKQYKIDHLVFFTYQLTEKLKYKNTLKKPRVCPTLHFKKIVLYASLKHNREPQIHGTLHKNNYECCNSKELQQNTLRAQLSSGSEVL